ncbi:MmgE/PrpD family protein [Rhodovibrionaceae bacterium A322]
MSSEDQLPRAYSMDLLASWAVQPITVPDSARREARLSLLDTLACLIAGTKEEQSLKVEAGLRAAGAVDGPACSVLGGPGLSYPAAALLNGTAMHALDFDDYETAATTHPSAPILAALLACTDGQPVSLGQILEAYIVGYECIIRLGEGLSYEHYKEGWHSTATVGALGAAAAMAKLLALPEEQFLTALSLASSMAAGSKLQFGTDTKAVQAGLAARAGVEAAFLAQSGLSAEPQFMEGKGGFFDRYGSPESPRWKSLSNSELPDSLALLEYPVMRKPWASCSYTHRTIGAALDMAAQTGFDAQEVKSGEISVPEPFQQVCRFSDPKTAHEARFSLNYCVAAALLDGEVTLKTFSEDWLNRPDLQTLMKAIELRPYDPGPDISDMSDRAPDYLHLTLKNGQKLSRTTTHVLGGALTPLTEEDLRQKFALCGGADSVADLLLKGSEDSPVRLSTLLSGE